MSKFYLAGPYPDKDKIRAVAEILILMGHEVCSSWLWRDNQPPIDTKGMEGEFEREATRDLEDLEEADAFVRFPRREGYAGGGRFVEQGFAIALWLPVILIGERECVFDFGFTSERVARVEDVEDFLDLVRRSHALHK